MVCMRIANGIVCVRKQRAKHCACGNVCTKQCDYVLRSGRTCDTNLCDEHAHVQPGAPADPSHGSIDYCPRHHAIVTAPPRPARSSRRGRPAHGQLPLLGDS